MGKVLILYDSATAEDVPWCDGLAVYVDRRSDEHPVHKTRMGAG